MEPLPAELLPANFDLTVPPRVKPGELRSQGGRIWSATSPGPCPAPRSGDEWTGIGMLHTVSEEWERRINNQIENPTPDASRDRYGLEQCPYPVSSAAASHRETPPLT